MKTLLVDDHPLILSALETVIQRMHAHVSLVKAETAKAAREALATQSPFDLVLLDLQLGDVDGFELLAEVRSGYPALSVVVVSASDRSADILQSIEMGAMGFVPKRATNDQLFAALELVMSGGIYVPPMTMRTSGASRFVDASKSAPADDEAAPTLESFGLTPRQGDVLALLLRGQSNKLIARELNLSVETIKDHVAAVLRTLKVHSRTQAVLAVSRMSNQGALLARREPAQRDATWRPAARASVDARSVGLGPEAGLARPREMADADERLTQLGAVDRLAQPGMEMAAHLVVPFGRAHGDKA